MPEPEHEPPEPSGPSPYEGPSVVPPPSSEVRPGSPALRDPERGRARPGWRDRFRRRRAPKPERPATKETRPARGNRRRVSAVDDFTDVAMWAGDFFGQRTPYRATGHAIALNASTTGFMLDDAVKGTLVDRGLAYRQDGGRGIPPRGQYYGLTQRGEQLAVPGGRCFPGCGAVPVRRDHLAGGRAFRVYVLDGD